MEALLDWLRANEALSGWVQTFGSIAALVVAIALPVAERRSASGAALEVASTQILNAVLSVEVALSVMREGELEEGEVRTVSKLVKSAASFVNSQELWRLQPIVSARAHRIIYLFNMFDILWHEGVADKAVDRTVPVDPDTFRLLASTAADLVDEVESLARIRRKYFRRSKAMTEKVTIEVERIEAALASHAQG